MKVKSFNLLQLEKIEVPLFTYNINLTLSENDQEVMPIEENLKLKAFIKTKKDDETKFRLGLILETAEKNKSKVDFAILSLFYFKGDIPITGEKDREAPYITTALSVSYSTLRGYLFQKVPEIGLLPLIPMSDLHKALEEGTKEFSQENSVK